MLLFSLKSQEYGTQINGKNYSERGLHHLHGGSEINIRFFGSKFNTRFFAPTWLYSFLWQRFLHTGDGIGDQHENERGHFENQK